MKCEYLGTEHLLLGLLKGVEHAAYTILNSNGVNYDNAYAEAQVILGFKDRPEGYSLKNITTRIKGKSLARRPCWEGNVRLKVAENGGLYVFKCDQKNAGAHFLLTMEDIEAKDWIEVKQQGADK